MIMISLSLYICIHICIYTYVCIIHLSLSMYICIYTDQVFPLVSFVFLNNVWDSCLNNLCLSGEAPRWSTPRGRWPRNRGAWRPSTSCSCSSFKYYFLIRWFLFSDFLFVVFIFFCISLNLNVKALYNFIVASSVSFSHVRYFLPVSFYCLVFPMFFSFIQFVFVERWNTHPEMLK